MSETSPKTKNCTSFFRCLSPTQDLASKIKTVLKFIHSTLPNRTEPDNILTEIVTLIKILHVCVTNCLKCSTFHHV